MKKILGLVLSTGGAWMPIVQAIRETWGSEPDEYLKINYYYGRMKDLPPVASWKSVQVGETIVCGCGEASREILKKTVIAFEHVIANADFDYLFRCCCTSYLDKRAAQQFLKDKPDTGFYCGIKGKGKKHPFASGSGYFLSRDLVEYVVKEREALLGLPYPGNQDDVCVGELLGNAGIAIHPGATRLYSHTKLNPKVYHYHFGVKGGADGMRILHQKLKSQYAGEGNP